MNRIVCALTMMALFGLTGCELLENEPESPPDVTGVVVGNGGNFGDQNGSLTLYNPQTRQASTQDDLGAFVNSLTLYQGRAYVVLNTFSTGHVDVVDLTTGTRVGQIPNLPAPRRMAVVSDRKAYVTNLSFTGTGSLSVLDLTTGQESARVDLNSFDPEGLVVHESLAWIADSDFGAGTTLTLLDTTTDRITGTVELGCDGPKDLFVDAEDEVVVVCTGKTVYNDTFTEILEQTNGQVLFVSPRTRQVTTRLRFDVPFGSTNGTQIATWADGALFVTSDGTGTVYRIDTAHNRADGTLPLPADASLTGLSGLAWDAAAERLYVGRFPVASGGFPDFTAAGTVVVLDDTGAEVTRFPVGPAPSHIELVRE